jgi:hypothetical protein
METAYDGSNNIAGETRALRGGSWYNDSVNLDSSLSSYGIGYPTDEDTTSGFRVAMIPEPSSLSLMVLGGLVMALRRRK